MGSDKLKLSVHLPQDPLRNPNRTTRVVSTLFMLTINRRRPVSSFARILHALLGAAAVGLAAATFLSFFASAHWILDLLTHMRLHLAVAAGGLLGLSILARAKIGVVLASAALIGCGVDLVPNPDIENPTSVDEGRPSIKLLMANVLTGNPDRRSLGRLIQVEDPDVIGLLEVDAVWVEDLRYLRGRYPYHLADPRSDNFGIAIYSKMPLEDVRLEDLGGTGLNAITTHIDLEDAKVELVIAHPVPPAGRSYSRIRNSQLKELAALRSASGAQDFILAGDLNTTPWSPHFRGLLKKTGLRRATAGLGADATWPTALSAPIRIPIDHTLVSSGLAILDYRIGPEIGSDHLPIIARLGLR